MIQFLIIIIFMLLLQQVILARSSILWNKIVAKRNTLSSVSNVLYYDWHHSPPHFYHHRRSPKAALVFRGACSLSSILLLIPICQFHQFCNLRFHLLRLLQPNQQSCRSSILLTQSLQVSLVRLSWICQRNHQLMLEVTALLPPRRRQ